MGSQDYCLGQSMKTLADAKALQYWAERTKPPILGKPHQLVGSILELRQAIKPFTTFKDSEVLSNNTAPWSHDVYWSHWVCPRGSFSVAFSRRWPGPSIGHITQTSVLATPLGETLLQCTVPTNQTSTCLPGQEENAKEPPMSHYTADTSNGSRGSCRSRGSCGSGDLRLDTDPPFQGCSPCGTCPSQLTWWVALLPQP